MKKEYILFIDSGVGGLSTLAETIKIFPHNYIFFADNAHAPYGSHSKKEIYLYLKDIINNLLKTYQIPLVVLACNTATTSAIESLRKTFTNILFIGTEPAVKLANDLGYKNILCLATPLSSKQEKYIKLANNQNSSIFTLAIKDFATNIQNFKLDNSIQNYFNLIKNIAYIKKFETKFDAMVLGCTHYVLVSDIICKFLSCPLVDGNIGVSKNINNTCSKKKIKTNNKPSIIFKCSYNCKNEVQKYKKILSQILANHTNLC